jgi:hypothetical protein
LYLNQGKSQLGKLTLEAPFVLLYLYRDHMWGGDSLSIKKLLCCFLAAGVILLLFPLTARADLGPKPSITVIVNNPPEEEYFLDLLIDKDLPYDNITPEERASYDPVKLNILENYNRDGWYPGLAHGTGVPLFGYLIGEREDDHMVHRFTYFGVPDYYRVIIVTPDNQVLVSEPVKKIVFEETIVLDYDAAFQEGSIAISGRTNLTRAYGQQFIATLIPTLIIEGIIFFLFRFSSRRNWLVFLGVNLLTQVVMTAILGTILISAGLFGSYLAFIPVELGIIVIEAIAFGFLLRGHSRGRRILFAVVANIISAFAGIAMMTYQYLLLFG